MVPQPLKPASQQASKPPLSGLELVGHLLASDVPQHPAAGLVQAHAPLRVVHLRVDRLALLSVAQVEQVGAKHLAALACGGGEDAGRRTSVMSGYDVMTEVLSDDVMAVLLVAGGEVTARHWA